MEVTRPPSPSPILIRSHAGLRGGAALLVVFYHLHFGGPRLAFEDATALFPRSYLMVDLFFILSGFIISHAHGGDRAAPMARAEYADFLLRRAIRLYPLHLFCLAYMAAFALFWAGLTAATGADAIFPYWSWSIETFATQLLLLNAWIPQRGWNIPSWSISAEVVAYALFPLTIVSGRCWRLAILIAVPAGFYLWVAFSTGSLDISWGLAPLRAVAGFFLGCLLYKARAAAARLSPAMLTILQIFASVVIVAMLVVPVNDALLIAPFALLIMTSWTDQGLAGRLLGSRPARSLGDISYSIYLNHAPVIAILAMGWDRLLPRLAIDPLAARAIWITLCVANVLIVSRLTFAFVEVPARRFLSRRLRGRTPGPIEASPAAP